MKKNFRQPIALLILTVCIPLLVTAQQIHWQRSNANVSGNIRHIAVASDGSLYTVSDSAIVTSLDRGKSWRPVVSHPPLASNERLSAVTVTNDNLVIVGTENRESATGTLYASTNSGETWHYISGVAGDQTIRSLITTPNGDVYLATYSNDSSYAIYHLRYGDISWQPIYRWTPEFPADVNTLASDAKGNLYMMGLYGVTVSYDQGASWYKLTPQVDHPYRSSEVTSTDSLVFSGLNDFGDERSRHTGIARKESVTNFTTQRVTSLAVNSIGHLFAGTEFGGVYRSTNSGGSWQQIVSGLTNTAIHSLYMTPGDTLYAGSFGNIFRSSYPTADIKELAGYNAKATFLESIYPNPAKSRVTIRYKLERPSQISIAIFDGEGKKIMQLMDESKVSGIYELYPDIAGLPPGKYQIKLIAEDGFDMKPLVIVR